MWAVWINEDGGRERRGCDIEKGVDCRERGGGRREERGGVVEKEMGCRHCRERHAHEHTHMQVLAGKAQRRPVRQEPTRRFTRNDRC